VQYRGPADSTPEQNSRWTIPAGRIEDESLTLGASLPRRSKTRTDGVSHAVQAVVHAETWGLLTRYAFRDRAVNSAARSASTYFQAQLSCSTCHRKYAYTGLSALSASCASFKDP